MNRIYQLTGLSGICGIILASIGGCAAQDQNQAAFFPRQEAATVAAVADAQSANGARNDAMLRAIHFDGDQLNALGKQKLDVMARGIGDGKLTVYVDASPDKEADKDYRKVVVAYLHEQGLKEEQIQVKDGVNPQTLSSADAGLSRLSKTENPGKGAAKQSGSDSMSAPTDSTLFGQ